MYLICEDTLVIYISIFCAISELPNKVLPDNFEMSACDTSDVRIRTEG
jgi:hypothetical protein